MKRSLKIIFLVILTSLNVIGCSETEFETKTESDNNYIEEVDTTTFTNAKEVSSFVLGNYETYLTGEQLYNLEKVNFDTVLQKANNAQRIMETAESGNKKVDSVLHLLILDDLPYHISDEAFTETATYLVKEFKNGTLFDNTELGKKLYMTQLLVENLDILGIEDRMASAFFDMFQALKDSIRINSDTFDEETISGLKHSLEVNIEQIKEYVDTLTK